MATRMVEVWNDDSQAYSELFRGELLTIPAKDKIVMEDPDAALFMGQYVKFTKDGQGKQIGCKMLRKVYLPENYLELKSSVQALLCMACNKEFKSQVDLDAHSDAMHASVMVDEEAKKKRASSK